MKLRDVVEAVLPAILEIHNSPVSNCMVTADTKPFSVKSRLAWLHEHDPESYPIWAAEDRGEIAGWPSFEPFRERPAYHATAQVNHYVVENHRRKGLGRRTAAEAIRYGAGRDFRESRSSTASSGIRRSRPETRQSLKGE